MRHSPRESGSILVITLLVLGALTVLGLATITLSGLDGEIAINQRSGDQAFYVAEAGIAFGAGQAAADISLINGTTIGPTSIMDGSAVAFAGNDNPAEMTVFIGPAPDPSGNSIQCGLVGYSDRFGSVRFRVDSTGTGPGGASREVQAVLSLPPSEGICPPGDNVKGGYIGG